MPIYEYRCESCGAALEKLQKISDPALRQCPECGKDKLVKMISASSFRLKGSGWYETDFKTGKKKHGAAEAGSESSGSDAAAPAPAASSPSSDGAGNSGKESNGSKESKSSKESVPAAASKTSKSSTD